MGYYIRVLGSCDPDIHIDELINAVNANGLTAIFQFDQTENPGNWTVLEISNQKGDVLAELERNPVLERELGEDELNEFKEIILDYQPVSAVKWLTSFFEKVKVIYAFRILQAAFQGENFEIISSIKTKIWEKTKGILQADNEGFSNEDGYHILWQFSEDAEGKWSCAVSNGLGGWDNFVMELSDKIQRKEFQEGKVPSDAQQL